MIRRVIASLFLATALVAPSYASTVKVDFSGKLTASSVPGLNVSEAFSGSFTYDTNATLLATNTITYAEYALATGDLSLTIGVNTVSNNNGIALSPDFLYVSAFPQLQVVGNSMVGSGPLNGTGVGAAFAGSSDPAFASLTLPFPFPTDFTLFETLSIITQPGNPPSAEGLITSINVTNTLSVPEPSTWGMMILGFGSIGFMAYRRKSKPTLMVA